jgi:anthranilate/para-aminobenzoate synthase component I
MNTGTLADSTNCVVVEDVLARALRTGLTGVTWLQYGYRPGKLPRYELFSFECPTAIEDRIVAEDRQNVFCGPEEGCGHFAGAWAGYIAYCAASRFEKAAPCIRPSPGFAWRFARLDCVYVHDRETGSASLQFEDGVARSRRSDFERALRRLEMCESVPSPPDIRWRGDQWLAGLGELDPESYMAAIEKIKSEIRQGEYYECNFTQRFRTRSDCSPAVVSARLANNCAKHSAYLDFGDEVILSASPELFLERRGSVILSRPIKGTLTRSERGANSAEALAGDPKNRAEHTMVIDLARNDLGRICEYGSISVRAPYEIENLPMLHQMVTEVSGRLKPGVGVREILNATFPPASITGAPKIRVMRAIAQHEISARGIYTGSIGVFVPNGDFSLNVAIRTLQAKTHGDGEYEYAFGAGGAIVADSDAAAEYAECLAKAQTVAREIG